MGLWDRLSTAQEHLFNRRAARAASEKRRLNSEAELYEKMAQLSIGDQTPQGEATREWALSEAKRLRLEAELK